MDYMREQTKQLIWSQFGAAIDALENAIRACPESLWSDQSRYHQFWHMAYHNLFWLDYYLTENPAEYESPESFGLEELDPSGGRPKRVYTQTELLDYLEHCRRKCQRTIRDMTEERAGRPYELSKTGLTHGELLLYNMRHVQHNTAQMNLLLRLAVDAAPPWTSRSKYGLEDAAD